jgi:hypothetical protein
MQRRKSTSNKPDHREKERYKGKKNTIYKERKEEKPVQRKVK